MANDFEPKAVCDAFYGDVVMCRSDSTGSENEVESIRERGDFLADEFDDVWYGRNLLYFDAELTQLGAKKIGVGVLCLARQDFVSDDHDARALRHDLSSNALRRVMPTQQQLEGRPPVTGQIHCSS